MKRGIRNKYGQMQISFSMIFSIILIIAFIGVAIYAIVVILNLKKCGQIGIFKEDLQEKINKMWSSSGGSDLFESNLPKGIEEVCFIDRSRPSTEHEDSDRFLAGEDNFFFFPLEESCEGSRTFEIQHIDIEEITSMRNPYCVENNGNVEIELEKGVNDVLVTLS